MMNVPKEKLEGFLDPQYADDLMTIINSVEATKRAEFKMAFDPTLVRGMSYYTGPIFEISMDEFGGSVGGYKNFAGFIGDEGRTVETERRFLEVVFLTGNDGFCTDTIGGYYRQNVAGGVPLHTAPPVRHTVNV